MVDKKATMIKISDLPGVAKFKSLRDAIKYVGKTMKIVHDQEVAKVFKKVRR